MQKISNFLIDKTEVTIGKFKVYAKETNFISMAEKNGGGLVYENGWVRKNGWNMKTILFLECCFENCTLAEPFWITFFWVYDVAFDFNHRRYVNRFHFFHGRKFINRVVNLI